MRPIGLVLRATVFAQWAHFLCLRALGVRPLGDCAFGRTLGELGELGRVGRTWAYVGAIWAAVSALLYTENVQRARTNSGNLIF